MTSTPSLPEDPDRRAARRAQQRREARALLQVLMARWPQAFPAHPAAVRPLALGTNQALAARLPEYTPHQIRAAIVLWRQWGAAAYLKGLVRGGPRYDLEGQPRGTVTAEEQQQARQELAAWQARWRERVGRTPRRSSPPARSTPAPDEN